MALPSSRRSLAVAVAMSSLMLAAAVSAPTVASGSMHECRTKVRALVRLEKSTTYGEIFVNASVRTLHLLTADTARRLPARAAAPASRRRSPPRGSPWGRGPRSEEARHGEAGLFAQPTYDGHPLYLYAGDAGQANGEGIESFGGTWYVLNKKGTPVTVALASASSGSSASGGGW